MGLHLGMRPDMVLSMIEEQTILAALRVALALEVYRARHGDYPDTLDRLVPGVIASLPADPYAESGSFRYTRLDKPDARGRGYWLHHAWAGAEEGGSNAWMDDDARFNATTAVNDVR